MERAERGSEKENEPQQSQAQAEQCRHNWQQLKIINVMQTHWLSLPGRIWLQQEQLLAAWLTRHCTRGADCSSCCQISRPLPTFLCPLSLPLCAAPKLPLPAAAAAFCWHGLLRRCRSRCHMLFLPATAHVWVRLPLYVCVWVGVWVWTCKADSVCHFELPSPAFFAW